MLTVYKHTVQTLCKHLGNILETLETLGKSVGLAPKVIYVYSGSKYLGKVTEQPHGCSAKHLEVWNDNEQNIFDIRGPSCPCSCGGDVTFQVSKKLFIMLLY